MWRWGASLGALGLALTMAQGASAQAPPSDPPPPINYEVDANGVDVITGALNLAASQAGIGPAGHGLSRVYEDLQFRDNNFGGINGAGTSTYTVSLGATSETFAVSGGTYTPQQQSGSTLSFNASTQLYTYTLKDGTVAMFNAEFADGAGAAASVARLQSLTGPSGEALSYSYTSYCAINNQSLCQQNGANNYKLASVSSNRGLTLNYSYQTLNGTTGMTVTGLTTQNPSVCAGTGSSCGTIASTTFNGRTETDPLGRTSSYPLPAAGTTQTLTPPTGNAVTVVYDGSTRVTSYSNGVGTWSYAYSTSGATQTTVVTDPNGNKKTYVSNPALDVITSYTDALNRVTSYAYDGYGRVTQVSYPHGNAVQYVYDGRGNVTTTTQVPAGGGTNIVTSASYDASCASPAKCNKPNTTTDGRGAVTSYTYDATTGVLLSVTRPTGANNTAPQTRYSYTWEQANISNGSGSTVQGAPIYLLTGVSSCGKGSAGGNSSCVGTANETRVTIAYDPNHNLAPVSVTTAAGDGSVSSTQSYSYDAYGNVASSTNALGGLTTYVYDADREVTGLIGPDPDGSGPRTPSAAQLTYDADGRVTVARTGSVNSQTDTGFSSFTLGTYKSYNYDGAGRLAQAFGGQVTSGTLGPAYAETDYQYDAANRLQCTAQRMNTASFNTATACNLTTAGIDGPDQITYHNYYNDDQPSQVVKGYGTSSSVYSEVDYYISDGTLGARADGSGNKTCISYDGFARKSAIYFPQAGSGSNCNGSDYNTFAYDADGELTSERQRDGSTLSFAYDALGNLTTGPDGATYGYSNYGQVTSAAYNNVTTTFTYDALGRKLTQASPIGTVSSAYDAAGDRTRLSWPDGFYVAYTYDLTGALGAVEEQGATSGVGLLASYSLDSFGRRNGVTYAGSNATLSQGFVYDSASRLSITGYTFADSSKNQQFWDSYTAASQLKVRLATNNLYDWNGASGATTSYGLNGLNQIATAAGATFGYTAQGSLSSDGTRSYGYDALQRLTSTTGFSAGYDGLGRLYTSSNGSASTYYLYDGSDLIGEYSSASSSATLRRYVPGIAGADDPIVWYEGSSTSDRRWLLKDQQGSVIAVANPSGQALAIDSYDAAGAPGQANLGRYGYTGQAWIPEAGLYTYKARYYSPTLNRFLTTDPIGYADGLNWYGYVHGDPVNGTDPTGKSAGSCEICGVLGPPFHIALDGGGHSVDSFDEITGGSVTQYQGDYSAAQSYFSSTSKGDDAAAIQNVNFSISMSLGGLITDGAEAAAGAGVAAGAAIIGGAVALFTPEATAADDTPENQFVVRGGLSAPDSLIAGSKVTPYGDGITGFSVTTAPGLTIDQLAAVGNYPNPQISYTTLAQLQGLGLTVVATPGINPLHATVIVPVPLGLSQAIGISSVFQSEPNPYRRR